MPIHWSSGISSRQEYVRHRERMRDGQQVHDVPTRGCHLRGLRVPGEPRMNDGVLSLSEVKRARRNAWPQSGVYRYRHDAIDGRVWFEGPADCPGTYAWPVQEPASRTPVEGAARGRLPLPVLQVEGRMSGSLRDFGVLLRVPRASRPAPADRDRGDREHHEQPENQAVADAAGMTHETRASLCGTPETSG